MAAPITHIVLANKVWNKSLSSFSKKDFLIGTSFPDIRYLKVIDRNNTHFKDLFLEDIKNDNSFMAGVKFHSIVDEVREAYMVSQNIYSYFPKSKYITQSLKLLEDELLYENFDEWNNLIKDFNDIPYGQIKIDLDKLYIEKWYSLLQEYFSTKPTPQVREKFIKEIGFTSEDAQEMNIIIHEAISNQKIRDIILGLYENFDLLLLKANPKK